MTPTPPRPLPPRPLHLQLPFIAVVGVGGALGTLARWALTLVIPTTGGLPWPTFTANIVGAFVLGLILESLSRRGRDEGLARVLRLGVGTGVLGGFTTYSTLAVETERLFGAGRAWEAIGYGVISVIVGFVVAILGMWVASVAHQRAQRRAGTAGDASEDAA